MSVTYNDWDAKMSTDELALITERVWIEGLKGLTRSEIDRGLDNLKGNFSPNPDTFRGWCKLQDNGLTHNTAAYKPFKKERAIEMSPELRKQYADERRAMLRAVREEFNV